jgi:hypothetical protein
MGHLQGVRQRFILAAALLGAINVALLVYLFLAGANSRPLADLQKQQLDLKNEIARRQKNNPESTRKDLKRFYTENLPARDSQISEQVDKLIRDNGVTTASIQYRVEPNQKGGLADVREIRIETNVTGDYEKVARFINALEQDKMLFIIEKISLGGQQGGTVSLQISFLTFLREPAPGPAPTHSNKGI